MSITTTEQIYDPLYKEQGNFQKLKCPACADVIYVGPLPLVAFEDSDGNTDYRTVLPAGSVWTCTADGQKFAPAPYCEVES